MISCPVSIRIISLIDLDFTKFSWKFSLTSILSKAQRKRAFLKSYRTSEWRSITERRLLTTNWFGMNSMNTIFSNIVQSDRTNLWFLSPTSGSEIMSSFPDRLFIGAISLLCMPSSTSPSSDAANSYNSCYLHWWYWYCWRSSLKNSYLNDSEDEKCHIDLLHKSWKTNWEMFKVLGEYKRKGKVYCFDLWWFSMSQNNSIT